MSTGGHPGRPFCVCLGNCIEIPGHWISRNKVAGRIRFTTMTSGQQFWPLRDLHHTRMQRMMLEEDSEEIRTYYACARRDCSRVFRDSVGYTDWIEGEFDDARAAIGRCPSSGDALYLAEVDSHRRVEIWECSGPGCKFSEESPSPAAQ
jgi:hypothetical protein